MFLHLNLPPSSLAERSDHQPRHRPLPGGGDVQRGQLWPAAGGPEVLRPEVDDTQLDQAPQALRPPPPKEEEPERVWTAFLTAGLADRYLMGAGEGGGGGGVCRAGGSHLPSGCTDWLPATESQRRRRSITVFDAVGNTRSAFSKKKKKNHACTKTRETSGGRVALERWRPSVRPFGFSPVNSPDLRQFGSRRCFCLCVSVCSKSFSFSLLFLFVCFLSPSASEQKIKK